MFTIVTEEGYFCGISS